MSTEQPPTQAAARPSQVAITQMLAEMESRRRQATRYWLLTLLAPLLLGAALLGYTTYAVYTRLERIKELDRQIAEKQKVIEEKNRAYKEQGEVLTSAVDKITDAAARKEIISSIEARPNMAAASPRVYIHVHDEGQQRKAREVAQALKKSGFVVPGIERRPERVSGTQVKFFRPEDKDVADSVAGVLAGQGVSNVRAVAVSGLRVPPGRLEVWFAPASPARPGDPVLTDAGEVRPVRQGTSYALIRGDFRTLQDAIAYAKTLSAKNLDYPVEVYQRDASRYYVTLGGHLTSEEAQKRVEYAIRMGLAPGVGRQRAYAPNRGDLGENLYR